MFIMFVVFIKHVSMLTCAYNIKHNTHVVKLMGIITLQVFYYEPIILDKTILNWSKANRSPSFRKPSISCWVIE